MKNYLEKVLAEIPYFFAHFSQCLFKPSRLIATELQQTNQAEWVSKGIEFLILSFLIALFIGQVLPEATNPVTLPQDDGAFSQLASQALFNLFLLFFVAAIAFGCWRLVGITSSFNTFFRLFAFFCGVTLVLQVFANSLTNIGMIDPVVAKNWIQLEQSAAALQPLMAQALCHTDAQSGELLSSGIDTNTLQQALQRGTELYSQATAQPLYLLGTGLQALVYLGLCIWLFMAWFSYGRQHHIATSKIWLSALLAVVLMFIASQVLSLVQTGSHMMALYRACVPGS